LVPMLFDGVGVIAFFHDRALCPDFARKGAIIAQTAMGGYRLTA
jgi:hypothetical protein